MTTKVATATSNGTAAQAAQELSRTLTDELGGRSPALVLLFASTKQPLGEIAPAVSKIFDKSVVLGASTAGEFTERGDSKGGVAALAVSGDYQAFAGIGRGLKDNPERAIMHAISELPQNVEGYPHRTVIMLLDPLAGKSEEATMIVANVLGGVVRLAGGAAGDDLKMASTFVSCNGTTETDAVVICSLFSKEPLGVGVHHGHEPISKTLTVTRAEGGTVHEIDGRPAWDVWAENTAPHAKKRNIDVGTLGDDEIPGFLLQYEAGLETDAGTYKIRAPLARDAKGSLAFACGIPQGSEIHITESVAERQIESAHEAARRARAQMGHSPVAGAVVFDCICRNLILGDQFKSAIAGISKELGGVPLAGFETYGEIALDAEDMSGFHNTTTVVLAFPAA